LRSPATWQDNLWTVEITCRKEMEDAHQIIEDSVGSLWTILRDISVRLVQIPPGTRRDDDLIHGQRAL
jgi:hypothetical protein